MIRRTSTLKVGENKGAPRIYLQGKWLTAAGFIPGDRMNVEFGQSIVVTAGEGTRRIAGKAGNTVAVIDLQNEQIGACLGNADKVSVLAIEGRITISPAYTVVLMRSRVLAPTEASFFSGGGFLSYAAKVCGFEPKVAVEINDAYADIFQANHPGAHLFNCSVEEVPWMDLSRFRPIGLMTMGIPCEPFSAIRRLNRGGQEKRDKTLPPEAHELGDMTFWGLRGVEALNPHTLVIEEVPAFLSSGAGYMLLNALRRLYAHVDYKILDPADFGSLTGRKRACIVATNKPIKWPEPRAATQTLASVFDPEPHDWFNRETKSWLFDHWDKQTAKGNGFASQVYRADSPRVGTIKKRYFAQQGDNPVIRHPELEGYYRWLTLNEVKRLHSIPDNYQLGSSKTLAGEVIGQGVVVSMFQQIIASVTNL